MIPAHQAAGLYLKWKRLAAQLPDRPALDEVTRQAAQDWFTLRDTFVFGSLAWGDLQDHLGRIDARPVRWGRAGEFFVGWHDRFSFWGGLLTVRRPYAEAAALIAEGVPPEDDDLAEVFALEYLAAPWPDVRHVDGSRRPRPARRGDP